MFLKTYRVYRDGAALPDVRRSAGKAQTDSLFLSVDQLFERGGAAWFTASGGCAQRSHGARTDTDGTTSSLPDLQVGLKGGFVGQPVVWERGCSARHIRIFRTGHELRHRLSPTTVSRWQDSEDYP